MTPYLGHAFEGGRCTICGAVEKTVRDFKTACSGPPPKPLYKPEVAIVIPFVTTQVIPGAEIEKALGIVAGSTIMGASLFRDISAGIRDIVGGRASAYEAKLREGREAVIDEMRTDAIRLGANAVVAVTFAYEVVGTNGSMLMICASGTAVKLRSEEPNETTAPASRAG